MASAALITAVNKRLNDNWSGTAVVEDDTTRQGPPDGSAYVTVEYPVSRENQITIGTPGANVFRESGVIRLLMSFPTGTGTLHVTTLMDQLRALFRSRQFDGVTTFAPSPPAIDPTSYQGGRFKVSSAVPYFVDLFG
jgi:uncharacterized protein DUF4128